MLGRNVYDNEDAFIELISKFTYLDTQGQLATRENALTMATLGHCGEKSTSPLNVLSADVFDHIMQFAVAPPKSVCIKEVQDGRGDSKAIIPFCGWKGQKSPSNGLNLADLSLFKDSSTIRIPFSTPDTHLTAMKCPSFQNHQSSNHHHRLSFVVSLRRRNQSIRNLILVDKMKIFPWMKMQSMKML
jgi:hypothetical protein